MIRSAIGRIGRMLVLLALSGAALAEPGLPALLQAVPMPNAPFQPGHLLFAYARLDRLAGAPGPTAEAGAARLDALIDARALAIGHTEMAIALGRAEEWPALLGFDLDAVDALLVAFIEPPSTNSLRVLAGAPRLRDAARIGPALAARGFEPLPAEGATPAWSFGAEGGFNPRARNPADPFGGVIGKSHRIAAPAGGLIVANGTEMLAAALRAWAGGESMAGAPDALALARGLGEAPGATLVQALGYLPILHVTDPAEILGDLGPPPSPEETRRRMEEATRADGPILPIYELAGLGELAEGERRWNRIVLAYDSEADAQEAAAVLAARLRLIEAGARPYGADLLRAEAIGPVEGLHLAVLDLAPRPGAAPLMRRWNEDWLRRRPLPVSLGVVPNAAMAR